MQTLFTLISTIAVLVGIVGIVPQLVTMQQTGSAGGQSTLGWALGAAANLALGFVNGMGNHAFVLAAGNLLNLTGCLTAVCLVQRFRGTPATAGETHPQPHPVRNAVAEMHTQEFVVLREAVLAEHHRRTGEPVLAF
jgi:hypothetical protein